MKGVSTFLGSRAGDYAVGITVAIDGGVTCATQGCLCIDGLTSRKAGRALLYEGGGCLFMVVGIRARDVKRRLRV